MAQSFDSLTAAQIAAGVAAGDFTATEVAQASLAAIEAREGGGPAEYFDWAKDLVAGTIERRLREHFTVAGYIFFLNCEQAQRYNILLYSSIAPEDVAPMGIKAFSDVNALLDAAQLEGKSIYVIPNGSTVIPHVREASKHEA